MQAARFTGALAVAFSAVALVVRFQPVSSLPRLVLSVGATFVPLIALGGLTLALLSRRRLLSVLAAVVLAATLAIQVSWYWAGRPSAAGPYVEVRVLASNLFKGRADAASFVATARDADLVTVAELTPEAIERLNRAGISQRFPYSSLFATSGVGGVGIWSRYPLTPLSEPRHRNVLIPAVRVHLPGVEFEPVVAAVHVMSPVAGDQNTVADWRQGMEAAEAQLDNFARAAGAGAVIVGGDYNSTPDMRQFRDLLTNGYTDAVNQTGSGYAPTFPSNASIPPVITIDHVLTRNAAASSVRTVTITGSDHRAVFAVVRVPR